MDTGNPGVVTEHPGPGITHNFPNMFPLLLLVTMDRALGTGWLGLAVGTFGQASCRVTHQSRTRFTQTTIALSMMVFTVDRGHAYQGLVLTLESAG